MAKLRRRLSILCGNGGLFLDFEIERGADGAMTGYCFTKALLAIVAAFERGDRELGHTIFDAHLPLIRYEQQPQVGLGVRKYVLAKCGVIQTDTQRMPATALTGQVSLRLIFSSSAWRAKMNPVSLL